VTLPIFDFCVFVCFSLIKAAKRKWEGEGVIRTKSSIVNLQKVFTSFIVYEVYYHDAHTQSLRLTFYSAFVDYYLI
jgi:hypothetical protein